MGQRLELQALLEEAIGSENVYFQPPEGFKLEYPCVVYQLDRGQSEFADNKVYSHRRNYQVTFITRNPDNDEYYRLVELPLTVFERFFIAHNLNHYVFSTYF